MAESLGILVLGLAAGVLVNYLADAMPGERWAPFCSHCGQPMSWKAYWRWWQPCPHCGKRRWRHGFVLFALGMMSLVLWWHPPEWGFWAMWVLGVYAAVVIVIDVEHRLILHEVSALGALLGAGLGVWRHGWLSTLWGGLAGAGIMLFLYAAGNGYAAWKAKRAGEPAPEEPVLGFGDVTLMGGLGLLLGWPGILAGLTLGILLGGGFSLLYLAYGLIRWRALKMDAYIPYGPFLVLGALLTIVL